LLRPASRLVGLFAVALGLALPSAAGAQTPQTFIDGNPLKIWTQPDGRTQVNVDDRRDLNGTPIGEFFNPFSDSGNAGVGLALDSPSGPGPRFSAFNGSLGTPTLGPASIPTGDPNSHIITTQWDLPDASDPQFRVTQVLTYTNGERQFFTAYSVENVGSSEPPSGRLFVAGDLAIRGSDSGSGILEPATASTPRFVGGLNQEVGGTGGFAEITPWSHYQVGPLFEVSSAANGAGFDDTISTEITDNAAGVQWDLTAADLRPGGEGFTAAVMWRFISTIAVTPTTATKQTGNSHTLTATVADPAGTAAGRGTDVIWQVAGANNTTPVKTNTGGSGKASFTYVGGAPGQDEVTAFVDQNGNARRDTNEAQVTANVTWEGPQPPQKNETANAAPTDGTVRVKFPSGAGGASARLAAKRLGVPLSAAQAGFVKLTENTPIPIGSTLDTAKGTVQLLTEGKPTKKTGGSPFSTAKFNGGTFKVNQKGKAGVAEMKMQGGQLNACPTGFPKGGAPKQVSAARKSRRLFGRGRGNFRTRGRNSSATVRGTKWLVKDTCKGTTTSVSQGKVVVRDFVRKRTVTLKKGQKYLAKAPKAKKRRGGKRGGLTR
jgi:hypothetical protein